MNDQNKLKDLSEDVHIHRHEQGIVSMHSLLMELKAVCLKSMAAGTKDTFDSYKGRYEILNRLIEIIEVGPKKIQVPQKFTNEGNA